MCGAGLDMQPRCIAAPLCHSDAESERLAPQHGALALLDGLLLLALVPELDEAIASAGQRTVRRPLAQTHCMLWYSQATYNDKQNIMGIIMVELKLVVLLLT